MTTVRVQDIVQPHIRRSLENHRTYYKLYRKVMRRVREAAKAKATHIEWACPPFMWDMQPYDPERAVNYIARKLKHGGFDIVRDKCHISIDWDKPAREHIRKAVSDTIRRKHTRTKSRPKPPPPHSQNRRDNLMHQAERLLTRMSTPRAAKSRN